MKFRLLIIFLTIFIFSSNSNAEEKNLDINILSNGEQKSLALKHNNVALINDKISYLNKTKKNLILVIEKKEIVIAENVQSEKFWLKSFHNFVYIIWWEKYAKEFDSKLNKKVNIGKALYARVSTDFGVTFGEKTRITNKQGKPLANLDIAIDPNGNATIVYQDERYPGHEIFSNSTIDAGKTWTNDLMLNNSDVNINDLSKPKYPFLVTTPEIEILENGERMAVWEQYIKETKKRLIISRRSLDGGKTWEKEVIIHEDPNNKTAEIFLFSNKKSFYLTASYAQLGMFLFKNKGDTWEKVSQPAPKTIGKRYISYVKTAFDTKYIYISFIFVPSNGGSRDWHTGIVRYNLNNNSWEKKFHQLDLTLRRGLSRGSYQDIKVLNDGSVVIVWQDYRRVLPSIYFSYSNDKGASWSTPLILNEPGKGIAEYPFIIKEKNNFFVFFNYSNLPESTVPTVITKIVKIPFPSSSDFKKLIFPNDGYPSPEELKLKLENRYKNLMKARIAKDWNKAWEFIDPVYRNLYSKNSWLNTRDKINYKNYKLTSIDINFPYATLKGQVTFDLTRNLRGMKTNDEKYKNMTQALEMKWGWFDNNWYYIADDPRSPYMP